MLVTELTIFDSSLNNILRALIVNENPEAVNTPCRDIVVRDIIESKPNVLVNCYSLKELEDSIMYLHSKDYKPIKSKEIVPNTFDLGLVRKIELDMDNLYGINLQKRFRYYFMFEAAGGKDKTICLTYNPECNLKKQISVKLESGVIKCTTLQVVLDVLKGRNMKSLKQIDTEQGKYNYYELEED